MQKVRFSPIILIVLLLLIGCSRSATMRSIDSANAVIEDYPDSALTILQSIDTASIRSEKERAAYAVALTNARYLAYSPEFSDTLLKAQKHYFDAHGDSRDKMIFLYLMSILDTQNGKYSDAVLNALNAADIAAKYKEYKYLGRIYRQISDIYAHEQNYRQSLKYANLAHDVFVKGGYEEYAKWMLWYAAQAYYQLGEYDNCKKDLDNAYNYALANNNKALKDDVKRLRSLVFQKEKNFRASVNETRSLRAELNSRDLFTLVWSYYNLAMYDSANYYNDLLLKSDPANVQMASNLAVAKGDYKKAYSYLAQTVNDETKLIDRLLDNNAMNIELEYHDMKSEIDRQKSKIIWLTLTCIIILISALTALLYLRHKKQMQIKMLKLQQYLLSTQLLQKELEDAKTANEEERQKSEREKEELQEKNRSLEQQLSKNETSLTATKIYNTTADILIAEIERRMALISDLCETAYTDPSTKENKTETLKKAIFSNNSHLFKKVTKIIERSTLSNAAKRDLRKTLDSAHDGVYSLFKKKCPVLYKQYGDIYLYKALGLSNTAIAYILGSDEKGVYNKTYQMRREIRALDIPEKDLILSVL